MTIDAVPGVEDLTLPDAIVLTRITGWRNVDGPVGLPSERTIDGQRADDLSAALHTQRDGIR